MGDKITASIIDTTLVVKRAMTGSTEIIVDNDLDGILQSLGVWGDPPFQRLYKMLRGLSAAVNEVSIGGSSNVNLTNVIKGVTLNFKNECTSILEVDKNVDTFKTAFEDSYNECDGTYRRANKSFLKWQRREGDRCGHLVR